MHDTHRIIEFVISCKPGVIQESKGRAGLRGRKTTRASQERQGTQTTLTKTTQNRQQQHATPFHRDTAHDHRNRWRQRYTWTRKLFGTGHRKNLDHVAVDMRSLHRLRTAGWSVRVLVAQVQVYGKHGEELRFLVQHRWGSYRAKRPSWLVRGRWKHEVHALHMSFPTVIWEACCKHDVWRLGVAAEARSGRPTPGPWRGMPRLWSETSIPTRGETVAFLWWKWAGHSARLESRKTVFASQ